MVWGFLDEPNSQYNITLLQKEVLNTTTIYHVFNVSISNGSTIINKMNYYYHSFVGDGQHPCFHFIYASGKMYVLSKGPINVKRYNDWVLSLVTMPKSTLKTNFYV